MNILVNGQIAVLKEETSFDYIFENRCFTGADSYSLSITFPLKDCPQNIAIFGHINRKDVHSSSVYFPCEIRDGSFFMKGTITIIEITDIDVKTQFLEGKSADNFTSDFESVYINELELGYCLTRDWEGDYVPMTANLYPITKLYNVVPEDGWIALPWVNNYSGNMQNEITLGASSASWKSSSQQLSFQCYMRKLTEWILNRLGFTCDFSAWKNSAYNYLLCCNTLPAAWDIVNYAQALPHWTVAEFLEELEMLMNCEFDVNRTTNKVTMRFSRAAILASGEVHIDEVLDAYTAKQENVSNCKYRDALNFRYATCSHHLWKFYECDWLIRFIKRKAYNEASWLRLVNVADMNALLQQIPSNTILSTYYEVDDAPSSIEQKVFYVVAEKRYYIARRIAVRKLQDGTPSSSQGPGSPAQYEIQFVVEPLNTFCEHTTNEDLETVELKCVPVWLDDLGSVVKGRVFFLDCGETEGTTSTASRVEKLLEDGEEETQEYHSQMYVGFWSGGEYSGKYPHPSIDSVEVETDKTVNRYSQSLALFDRAGNVNSGDFAIDPLYKFTFKFFAKDIPNVRALFFIQGQRYVCEKLSVTFGTKGRSDLIKGEFYRLL